MRDTFSSITKTKVKDTLAHHRFIILTKVLHLREPQRRFSILDRLTLDIDVCGGGVVQTVSGVGAGVRSRVAGAQGGDGQVAAVWVRVVSVAARLHAHTLRPDGASGVAQRPAQLAVTPEGRGGMSPLIICSSLPWNPERRPQPTLRLFMFRMAAVTSPMGTLFFLFKTDYTLQVYFDLISSHPTV